MSTCIRDTCVSIATNGVLSIVLFEIFHSDLQRVYMIVWPNLYVLVQLFYYTVTTYFADITMVPMVDKFDRFYNYCYTTYV